MTIHLHWYHLPASILLIGAIISLLLVWAGRGQGALDQSFTTLFVSGVTIGSVLLAGAFVLGHYL